MISFKSIAQFPLCLTALLAGALGLCSCSSHYGAGSVSNIKNIGDGPIREYMAFDSPAIRPHNKKDVKIKISLSNQALYAVENGKVLLATPISPGKDHATPKGNFTVRRQVHKYRANTHGWAHNEDTGQWVNCKISNKPSGKEWKFIPTAMPYWTEFNSIAYGIHVGFVYSYPRSHGCIRVHHNVMPKLFQMVQKGTPINISDSQPEDATAGRNMKRPPDPEIIPDDPVLESSDDVFYFHKPVQFVNG